MPDLLSKLGNTRVNKRNILITLRGLIIHLEKQILDSDWHRVSSKNMVAILLSTKKKEDIAVPKVQRCASNFTVNAQSGLYAETPDLLIRLETAFPNQP